MDLSLLKERKSSQSRKTLYINWLRVTVLLVCVLFYYGLYCLCICMVFSYCTVQQLVNVTIGYYTVHYFELSCIFVTLFQSFYLVSVFLSIILWCIFVALFLLFLSCFGRCCLVAYGINLVVHTTRYYHIPKRYTYCNQISVRITLCGKYTRTNQIKT